MTFDLTKTPSSTTAADVSSHEVSIPSISMAEMSKVQQDDDMNQQSYSGCVIAFFPSRAVAVSILNFEVHWYGLLYLAGFLIAAMLLPKLQRYRDLHLPRDAWMSFLSWSVIGVIAGGRLGYAIFYEPKYFLDAPTRIFAVWQGGMSFHGGFLGVFAAVLIWSRRNRIPLLALADTVVVPVAIGLALGRLGNFINQELYGTVTTLPWGMSFPGAEGLRHPVQLYAAGKDLLIAVICFWHLGSMRHGARCGGTGAAFLMLYGLARFLVEYIREPTSRLTAIGPITLTRGQVLTLPVFFMGLGLFIWLSYAGKCKR